MFVFYFYLVLHEETQYFFGRQYQHALFSLMQDFCVSHKVGKTNQITKSKGGDYAFFIFFEHIPMCRSIMGVSDRLRFYFFCVCVKGMEW